MNNLDLPDFTNRIGDKRLGKRGQQFVRILTHTAHSSIRRISRCRAGQKAFYRFLNNEKVSEQTPISEVCERSASLCGKSSEYMPAFNFKRPIDASAMLLYFKNPDRPVNEYMLSRLASVFRNKACVVNIVKRLVVDRNRG